MGQFVAFPLPDGTYFQIRHLPMAVIEEIEKKHGTPWLIVVDAPQMNGGVLADLAREVAIANDLDMPKIDTAADLIVISDSLVVVDDDGRRVAAPTTPEFVDTSVSWSAQ